MAVPSDTELRHAGDLKERLVAFVAEDPRLRDAFSAVRPRRGHVLREGAAADTRVQMAFDAFLLTHKLPDGRTPVQVFADENGDLGPHERETVRAWADPVTGIFAVRGQADGGLMLENLIDDLTYRTYSNKGRGALGEVPERGFLVGSLVPWDDVWLLSGPCDLMPAAAERSALRLALKMVQQMPYLVLRNPVHLEASRSVQRQHHEAFVAFFDSDTVTVPGGKLAGTLEAYYRHYLAQARTAGDRRPPPLPPLGLDPRLQEARAVSMLSDPVEGLHFLIDYDRLEEAVARPPLAAEEPYRSLLRGCLAEPSVSPLAVRRLARDHLETVSEALALALDRPGFSWTRDGEALMREHKPNYFRHTPEPSTVVLPSRLLAVCQPAGRNEPCPCGSGRKFKRCCGG